MKIRNSLRYIANKDQKEFIKDLKMVYKAPTVDNALFEVDKVKKWGKKYPLVIKQLKDNWTGLRTFYDFPEEIRTIIYTLNCVEALHHQLGKVAKSVGQFSNYESLTKMIY